MKMFNPCHPGEILKEECMVPLGISTTKMAEDLGVSRKTISDIINQHSGISPEMALKLAKAFNTSPELWINMQRAYDLWHAEKKVDLSKIIPYPVNPISREEDSRI